MSDIDPENAATAAAGGGGGGGGSVAFAEKNTVASASSSSSPEGTAEHQVEQAIVKKGGEGEDPAAMAGSSAATASSDNEAPNNKSCKSMFWYDFKGSRKAVGFAYMACGHGSIHMSNVFLGTAFIYLASEEAGCITCTDPNNDKTCTLTLCPNKVYGFTPSTIITNIVTIAGLITAFVLPIFGAIIDFTHHRRLVGRWVAALICVIQGIQISIGSKTWFPLAILQAFVAALFEIHYLLTLSYLPDVVRYDVDEATMNTFTRYFLQIQFGGELIYVFVVTMAGLIFKMTSVQTGRLGQAIGTVWVICCFIPGWRRLPKMKGRHEERDHPNILIAGFRQNYRTVSKIYRKSKTLWVFFTTVMLCEAGTTALLPIAITFLTRVLKYDAIQIGAAFFIALLAAMPGVAMSAYFAHKYNPATSLKIMLVLGTIVTIGAALALREERAYLGYVWAVLWGITNGWYWAGEQLLFNLVLPEGQEAELTGFFVYTTIVLSWVCPFIYSALVSAGVPEWWGLTPLAVFKFAGCLSLCRLPDWSEVRESTKIRLNLYDDTQFPSAIAKASAALKKDENDTDQGNNEGAETGTGAAADEEAATAPSKEDPTESKEMVA